VAVCALWGVDDIEYLERRGAEFEEPAQGAVVEAGDADEGQVLELGHWLGGLEHLDFAEVPGA